MHNWRQRSVAVLTLIMLCAALTAFSAAPAHAAGSITKAKGPGPNVCYWINDYSASHNIYNTNGSVAGYYEVFERHYTCTTSYHDVVGEFVITAATFTCTLPSFQLDLSANSVNVVANNFTAPHTIGGSNSACGGGTSYTATSSTWVGSGYQMCGEINNINFGTTLPSLKAGASCPPTF